MTDMQKKLTLNSPILKLSKRYSSTDWAVAIAVAITIIWHPLVAWVIPFDAAGRIPFILLGMAFILYFNRIWKTSLKYPLVIYSLVAIYMFVNGMVQEGYKVFESDGKYLMFCVTLQPVAIMLIIAAAAKKDFDCTLDWVLLSLYTYPVLSLLFSSVDIEGRLNGGINANEVALTTAIFCALMLLKYLRRRCGFTFTLLSLIIPLFVILRTGSRMGLAMVAATIFAAFFIRQKKASLKSLFFTAVFIAIFAWGWSVVMSQTITGERMKETTTQTEEKAIKTGTVLDMFGDRGLQYFYSWPYFKEHPIFGIGFGNWINYSPQKIVCHSEYMVQYVENGLLAFIPYMLFFISLAKRTRKARRTNDRLINQSASMLYVSMLTIAFSNSVLWSYNQFGVFAIYAFCFALTDSSPIKHKRIKFVIRRSDS